MADQKTDLRIYMLALSREVTEAQFNELKFVLNDVPNGMSDKMQQPYELFQALEQVRKLTPTLLKKTFDAIGRQDLSDDVTQHQHLFEIFYKQEIDATQDARPTPTGYDDIVCDGPEEDDIRPEKLPEKEGIPISAPYNSMEETNSHGLEEKLLCKESYHQPDTVSEALPDDVVVDGGEDTESTDEGASAAKNNNPGISTSSSEGAPNGSHYYENTGARPKKNNPGSTSSNAKGPSEQKDHVTTPKESDQSEFATASKYDKSPTGAAVVPPPPAAAAATGAVVGNGKDASEGTADFTADSGLHGSLHTHEDVTVKLTTTSVFQSQSAASIYNQGATGGYQFGSNFTNPPAAAAYGVHHNTGQQQMTCYSKEGYVLRIPQGRHDNRADGAGIVVMKSGQRFCLEVQNNSDYACEVDVTFGGRYLGVWLVENGQNNTTVISGSAWESGSLTFFSKADRNAPSSLDQYAQEANGVIECVFAPEAIKLFVETTKISGARHEVVICTRDTVEDLVTKITEICGIRGISCLLYQNKELCRTNALAKYKLKFEDIIRVLTDEEDLVIKCHGGYPMTVPVDPRKTTAKDVMVCVEQNLQIPFDRQRLTHKGERLTLERKITCAFLDGDQPFVKLEIADPINIKVRQPSGDEKYLRTHTFATVKSLKKQMLDEGMEGGQLMFNESCLKDDSTVCLAEHGIGNGSVLEIKPQETRNVHRGISSGSRSFGLTSATRSYPGSSSLFSFLNSDTRGSNLGACRGLEDEPDTQCTGKDGSHGRTHGLWGFPGEFAEGKLLLTGDEEISKTVDNLNRKFEKKLAVTLKLKLVSNDVGADQFPSLPSPHESRPSPHRSPIQAPARPCRPTRTKVPPPVPE